jgi:hypothetical protein
MTTQEKQMIDGSLIVVAQKFEILAKMGNESRIEKRFQPTTKRAELRSYVDLMNKMYKENNGACYYEIDEQETLNFLNKRAGVKEPKKDDELETLRAEYKKKFDEDAKGNWGVKKLKEVLAD